MRALLCDAIQHFVARIDGEPSEAPSSVGIIAVTNLLTGSCPVGTRFPTGGANGRIRTAILSEARAGRRRGSPMSPPLRSAS